LVEAHPDSAGHPAVLAMLRRRSIALLRDSATSHVIARPVASKVARVAIPWCRFLQHFLARAVAQHPQTYPNSFGEVRL